MLGVGEHGDRRGTCRLVGVCLRDRIEIGDLPGGRRGALHLGDHRGRAASERAGEVARGRHRERSGHQGGLVERMTLEIPAHGRNFLGKEAHGAESIGADRGLLRSR